MIGAIIGDVVGSRFEFNNIKTKNFELFNKNCFFTDDTVMTLAIMEICNENNFDKDFIIDTLKKWGRKYKGRGYGGSFSWWLNTNTREPYWSFGNGAAMRISPVGLFAKNEEDCKTLAKKVTEITHDHPEGLKGAEVVAILIYKAKNGSTKKELENYAISMYPQIKQFEYTKLVKKYSFNETCQDSVPQAIYCFLISNSFEDCLRTTISIGGDCDTTAAISCAIAEAYYGVPKEMINNVGKYLPLEIKKTINNFYQTHKEQK